MTDDSTVADSNDPAAGGTSRRRFLGWSIGGAGAVAAGAAGFGIAKATEAGAETSTTPSPQHVAFYGEHQAGIATPAQDRLAFAAFDVRTADPMALQVLLAKWAAAASRLTQGEPIGTTETAPQSPPIDTGEAIGLGPSNLTITVGFGPSLFDDRFGLKGKRPAALVDLPEFGGEALEESRSGGDLCVQACSDDPQVAFHVIRNFSRMGRGVVTMRWSQLGFGRTSTTSSAQATPRNLMGFKDGTNNIKAEDTATMASKVWVGSDTDQTWMVGGSYLVARRIRMFIESWDADFLADQEAVFGRAKISGAPLTGSQEFDVVDLNAEKDGVPVIAADAHIRLAAPESNGGARLLRRGYSYTDGNDPQTGALDAGLFFIAFQNDPRTGFIPVQTRLGRSDALNEYIRHVGSALFAVPPGLSGPGDWYGKALFRD